MIDINILNSNLENIKVESTDEGFIFTDSRGADSVINFKGSKALGFPGEDILGWGQNYPYECRIERIANPGKTTTIDITTYEQVYVYMSLSAAYNDERTQQRTISRNLLIKNTSGTTLASKGISVSSVDWGKGGKKVSIDTSALDGEVYFTTNAKTTSNYDWSNCPFHFSCTEIHLIK